MENIVAEYFYDRYGLGIETTGVVAAGFGVMNVVARPGGGMISHYMASLFGMRGRLWGLWVVQSVEGLFCVVMGRMTTLPGSVASMVGLSLFVQAASGLTFGVAPFVSNRYVFGPTTTTDAEQIEKCQFSTVKCKILKINANHIP